MQMTGDENATSQAAMPQQTVRRAISTPHFTFLSFACIMCIIKIGCLLQPAETAVSAKASAAPDYYKILEVPRSATATEIKKKYYALSKKLHPDINKQDSDAQEKWTRVAEAYEILSNAEQRAKFDSLGPEEYKKMKGGGAEANGNEFWGGFPFFFFGQQQGREKAPTLLMKLYVTLDQMYTGDLLHVSFRRQVLCMHLEDCLVTRNDCQSKGIRLVRQAVAQGYIMQKQIEDSSCVSPGKGWKKGCSKCPQGSTEMERVFISAYVEAGSKSGERLDFKNIGAQMIGRDPGDLIFVIVEQPNQLNLERRGNHLHSEMKLTLLEALVGFEKKMSHVSGKDVKIIRSGVTANNQVEVLKGWGMPVSGAEGSYGNLHVTFKVSFPAKLSEAEQQFTQKALEKVTSWKYFASPA